MKRLKDEQEMEQECWYMIERNQVVDAIFQKTDQGKRCKFHK